VDEIPYTQAMVIIYLALSENQKPKIIHGHFPGSFDYRRVVDRL
jgi:hypothetical protein